MSDQPEQRTPAEGAHAAAAADEATAQATRVEGSARVAEVHREVAETDVRRAEEEREQAEQEQRQAEEQTEKLSRKERKAREKAEQAAAEALDERSKAQEAERQALTAQRAAPSEIERPTQTPTASVTAPGVGSTTAPRAHAAAAAPDAPAHAYGGAAQTAAERPELLVGAAFAGAFLFARILRAIAGDDA